MHCFSLSRKRRRRRTSRVNERTQIGADYVCAKSDELNGLVDYYVWKNHP